MSSTTSSPLPQPEVNNFNLILHLLGVPPSEASTKLPGITTSSQFFDDAYFSTQQKTKNIPDDIRKLRQAIIKEEGWAKLPPVSSFFWQKVLFDTEEDDEKKDAISLNDEQHEQEDDDDSKNLKPCPFNNIQATMARAFRIRRLFKPYWKDYSPLMSRDDAEEIKTDKEEFLELRKKVERNPKAYQRMLKKRARDDFKDHKPSADFWEVFYKKDTFKFCPDDDDGPELSLSFLTFCKIVFAHSALDNDLGRASGSLRPLFLRRYSSLMQRCGQSFLNKKKGLLRKHGDDGNTSNQRVLDEHMLVHEQTSIFWSGSIKLILTHQGQGRLDENDTDFDNSDCDYADADEETKKRREEEKAKTPEEEAEAILKATESLTEEEIEKFCNENITIIEDVEDPELDDASLEERTFLSSRDKAVISGINGSCYLAVCEACFVDDKDDPQSRMDVRKDIATLAFLCNLQQPRHVAVMRRTGQDLADATRRFQEIDDFIAKKIVFNLQFFGCMCSLLYTIMEPKCESDYCPASGGSLFWSQYGLSLCYWFLLGLYHQILHDEEITDNKILLSSSPESPPTTKFYPVLSYAWDLSYGTGATQDDHYPKQISDRILDKFNLQKLSGNMAWYLIIIQLFNGVSTELSDIFMTPDFHEFLTFAALPCIFNPAPAEWCCEILSNIFDASTENQLSPAFATEEVRDLILCSLGPSAINARSSEAFFTTCGLITSKHRDFFAESKLQSGFWNSFTNSTSASRSVDFSGIENIKQIYLDHVSQMISQTTIPPTSTLPPTDRLVSVVAEVGEKVNSGPGVSWYCSAVSRLVSPLDVNLEQAIKVIKDERIMKTITQVCPKAMTTAEGLRNWCSLLYWMVLQIKRLPHIDRDLKIIIDEKICGKEVCACMVEKINLTASLSSCAMWWATAFGELGLVQRETTKSLRVEFATPQFRRACKFVQTLSRDDENVRSWANYAVGLVEAVEAIAAPPDPFLSSRMLEDEYDREEFMKERRSKLKHKM